MEMTSRPGERRFYAEVLTLLGAPQRPRTDIAQVEQAVLRITPLRQPSILTATSLLRILQIHLFGQLSPSDTRWR
jgi:hypothetical protein